MAGLFSEVPTGHSSTSVGGLVTRTTHKRSWAAANSRSSQIGDHFLQTGDDARHTVIIELVRRVLREVIIGVAKRRGVRHHYGGIAFLPESPVIGPADARQHVR